MQAGDFWGGEAPDQEHGGAGAQQAHEDGGNLPAALGRAGKLQLSAIPPFCIFLWSDAARVRIAAQRMWSATAASYQGIWSSGNSPIVQCCARCLVSISSILSSSSIEGALLPEF